MDEDEKNMMQYIQELLEQHIQEIISQIRGEGNDR